MEPCRPRKIFIAFFCYNNVATNKVDRPSAVGESKPTNNVMSFTRSDRELYNRFCVPSAASNKNTSAIKGRIVYDPVGLTRRDSDMQKASSR